MTPLHINPEDLNFDLPESLIAQEPLEARDHARFLILDRKTGSLEHRIFSDIVHYLHLGDVLVINRAKVSRAKLIGKKKTGGKVEIILIEPTKNQKTWKALVRPFMKIGTEIEVGDGNKVILIDRTPLGENILEFKEDNVQEIVKKYGSLPLPPYIKRENDDPRTIRDAKDYQTVYATETGSLAAPTAGLHFTEDLLQEIKGRGIRVVNLTLHVGWGTFRPIAKSVNKHEMLSEKYEITKSSFEHIKKAKAENRRIISVGTTSTRVLESLNLNDTTPKLTGDTNLFIKPGFKFNCVSALITNFHVPRSTPIALTSAFAGFENLEKAYAEAIKEKYRFFSYGDAMMII